MIRVPVVTRGVFKTPPESVPPKQGEQDGIRHTSFVGMISWKWRRLVVARTHANSRGITCDGRFMLPSLFARALRLAVFYIQAPWSQIDNYELSIYRQRDEQRRKIQDNIIDNIERFVSAGGIFEDIILWNSSVPGESMVPPRHSIFLQWFMLELGCTRYGTCHGCPSICLWCPDFGPGGVFCPGIGHTQKGPNVMSNVFPVSAGLACHIFINVGLENGINMLLIVVQERGLPHQNRSICRLRKTGN